LIESQLKQIVTLQKDVESSRSANPFSPVEPENKKDQIIRDLRTTNDELLAERRQLMETVESLQEQNKAGHKNLEESLDRVNELEFKVNERDD